MRITMNLPALTLSSGRSSSSGESTPRKKPSVEYKIGYMGHIPSSRQKNVLPIKIDDSNDPEHSIRPQSRGEAMVGYMGYKKLEYPEGDSENHRIPIVGYSGWYAGKSSGKLGRTSLHKATLSQFDEPEFQSTSDYDGPEQVEENPISPSTAERRRRLVSYREASSQLKNRRVDLDKILQDIQLKLENQFISLAEKRIHIRAPFLLLDKLHTGTVSSREFENCLIKLNVVLPWAELVGLLWRFDPSASGRISYVDFIHSVCPQLK